MLYRLNESRLNNIADDRTGLPEITISCSDYSFHMSLTSFKFSYSYRHVTEVEISMTRGSEEIFEYSNYHDYSEYWAEKDVSITGDYFEPVSASVTYTVTLVAQGTGGQVTKTFTILVTENPLYYWESVSGTVLSLSTYEHDESGGIYGIVVLRQGINGFSADTKNVVTEQNMGNMGEFITHTSFGRRSSFGFRVAILGGSRETILHWRTNLIELLSEGGKLYTYLGSYRVSISVPHATVTIVDGLQEGRYAKVQYADISFDAPDPFFYADERTRSTSSVYVSGNVDTPAEFTLSADTVTKTVGGVTQTITGTGLSGKVLKVTDNEVSVTGGNLSIFNISSKFFMLSPGSNYLTGVSQVKFRARWSAI